VGFIDRRRVEEFWDRVRREAGADQQTGYLQDEWPSALGRNRFRGEWRDVSRWLDELGVARGSCLDVGCGVGVWLEALAGRFARAHGIDLSAEMVASATKSVLDLGDDARYDLVFVGGVLMYLDDDEVEGMVARLARLVAPGGLLILRESSASPKTWYRDKPLAPGLHADRSRERAPYQAIYRPPGAYREMAERQRLQIVRWHANRHYAMADITEEWLRAVDKLCLGALAGRRPAAEKVARALYALRAVTLWPPYLALRWMAKIGNWWTVCRQPRASLSAARASSSLES
jgi:SAM-dependent methyltransferase